MAEAEMDLSNFRDFENFLLREMFLSFLTQGGKSQRHIFEETHGF